MADEKTTNTLINAELPPSVDNAFKNLTDQPTLTVGTIVSDLFDLTFGHISFWAEKVRIYREAKLDQYRQKLLSSASNIPSKKLVEPSIQIICQAMEDSKYCLSEEVLQDMFVSLISNSMNADFSKRIHPSFSGIIKQMSALDAKIITLFKNEPMPGLPVCQYRLIIPGIAGTPFFNIPEHIFLEIPEGAITPNSISLSSLSRFGLITISYFKHLTDEALYDKFYRHPYYKDLQTDLQAMCPTGNIAIQKGIVNLTPLGQSFVDSCVPH